MTGHGRLPDFLAAILDLDGTLLDSTRLWHDIDVQFLKKRGIPAPPDYMENIKTLNYEIGAAYTKKRFHLRESEADIIAEWHAMALKQYRDEIGLKPHAAEFLAYLKKHGVTICAATASDESLFLPALKRCGILPYFSNFTQTREVNRDKGAPDVYIRAAFKNHVSVGECIVVEDTLKSIQGARAGGFFTVGVADAGSADQEDEIRKTADLFVQNLGELIA
ncbi:MAG: HAD family phosphatase [Lachnospiraceae bacterium]|jgi:HAD superfamily hydrolase (TIGR01509 family)|nr:HAD family phosphatase [Lachnospiraceae bacterium]MCI1360140.1 HAD family phosphatase [Lachnospiraceae bacterium]MCI1379610.1 HAD family phosphatase [Lachnospiraceae bacterium]MCI1400495.1 HAD family phosphatase [Lachnospiraceae bacterium]MCI1429402.1 HAD family phosphatase [Lachnospiraceae bacterium]